MVRLCQPLPFLAEQAVQLLGLFVGFERVPFRYVARLAPAHARGLASNSNLAHLNDHQGAAQFMLVEVADSGQEFAIEGFSG